MDAGPDLLIARQELTEFLSQTGPSVSEFRPASTSIVFEFFRNQRLFARSTEVQRAESLIVFRQARMVSI